MMELAAQRCFNHPAREAAARCPECRRCFCRECVTEHEDRLICAACLRKRAATATVQRRPWIGALRCGQFLCGVLVAWLFFYALGRGLLEVPTAFHEGTIWKAPSEAGE